MPENRASSSSTTTMAANKFATMLHRNTNRTTVVLVYAILEWILIILLLLNSLLSCLIVKFADYFGLKRPCVWCSRIDHIIEPKNSKNCYRDLVCEAHASEISKLGYCYTHRKLAESEYMCKDCSSSSSLSSESDYVKFSKSFGLFPWMKQKTALIQNADDDKATLRCSCCGAHLESRVYPPWFVAKPSLSVLDYTQIQNLITRGEGNDVDAEIDEGDRHSDRSRSDFAFENREEDERNAEENRGTHVVPDVDQTRDKKTEEIPRQHLEFFIHGDNRKLIPVELVDSPAAGNRNRRQCKVEEDQEGLNGGDEDVILDFDMPTDGGTEAEPIFENWRTTGDTVAVFSGHKCKKNSSLVLHDKENLKQNYRDVNIGLKFEAHMERREGEIRTDVSQASEEGTEMQGDEFEADVSIGTEIPDQEHVDDYQIHDNLLEDSNQHIREEDQSPSSVRFHAQDESGGDKDEEEFVEFKTMSIETSIPRVLNNHLASSSLEYYENEEEEIPDTPTSVESLHHLHKKLLLLERKGNSGTEESLDGSVISDIESGEIMVEKLKLTLKTERKALSSLYAELEEERSASAVAANQTMAMINRLQEEKAAMQMEALQYQRMMEEQSEYDQGALQLLNELIVKREKEKQELEKELEIYRKKVHDFEIKERMVMLRSRTNPSVSCSNNSEDSDGVSIDLNPEVKEENMNTPINAVLYLEESLPNFEEERLSILEQLKVLEEKLVMLNHEEQEEQEQHICHENGNGYQNHVNGYANGHGDSHAKEINGGRKIMGPKGKSLLPLFDAIGTEEEDGMDLYSLGNFSVEKVELEKRRVDLGQELDSVHERLQALEADREFVKHCIKSLRKGDKGLNLLQEILQHLRDLRNVELRVSNMRDLVV